MKKIKDLKDGAHFTIQKFAGAVVYRLESKNGSKCIITAVNSKLTLTKYKSTRKVYEINF
jgi:hypothetical protein